MVQARGSDPRSPIPWTSDHNHLQGPWSISWSVEVTVDQTPEAPSPGPQTTTIFKKLSSLPNGEANNYKRVGLDRVGGVGIPSLPIRDPLPSARGPKLALNGRAMIFMLTPRETQP
ncbi:hypothetical protein MTR67_026619 [Solanum verrucosum]|uniref:Uncharacterized protein n=1 Tax=Solanum verrucosum TaxID=315347 RepID=A0AAF0TUZ4_SOLVR|nr:hypothetical protein MTR67_026619 [Solanum verrucosum]